MSAETDALDLLLELSLLVTADMDSGLEQVGLTPSRAHLTWVLHSSGPSSQRRLADALGVSPRSITGLVDALEASGLVVREPDPQDRRAFRVTLTPHGAAAMERMEEQRDEFARQLFGPLPARRLRALVSELDGLTERLKSLVDQEAHRGADAQ